MVAKRIFKELIIFFIQPIKEKYEFGSSINKIKFFLKTFVACLLIVIFLSIITALIRYKLEIAFKILDIPLSILLFINLLIIPLIEETAFRLPLKLSRINFSLSISIIIFIVVSLIFKVVVINYSDYLHERISISLASFVFVYTGTINRKIYNKFEKFWTKNYRGIFYSLLVLFVLRHLDNYIIDKNVLLFFPILALPQLVIGIFLSFIRIRIGFIFSVIFHGFINLFSFLPKIIMYYVS